MMAGRPLWSKDLYGLLAFIPCVKFFNNMKIICLHLLSRSSGLYGQETVKAGRPLWSKDLYGLLAQIQNVLKFFLAIQGLRTI